jgi:hypothetical protein
MSFPCTGCSSTCQMYTTSTGTVSDGPSAYANGANCKWLIAPLSAVTITITLTEFQTEHGCDYLTLSSCTNAGCESKQQILQHSGDLPYPSSVTTSTGFLLLEFMSDSSVTRNGFTATWTSELLHVADVRAPSFSVECNIQLGGYFLEVSHLCVAYWKLLQCLLHIPAYIYTCNYDGV